MTQNYNRGYIILYKHQDGMDYDMCSFIYEELFDQLIEIYDTSTTQKRKRFAKFKQSDYFRNCDLLNDSRIERHDFKNCGNLEVLGTYIIFTDCL